MCAILILMIQKEEEEEGTKKNNNSDDEFGEVGERESNASLKNEHKSKRLPRINISV